MSKNIILKLKSAGSKTDYFSVMDSLGNLLDQKVAKKELFEGKAYTILDTVLFLILTPLGNKCCGSSFKIKLSTIDNLELASMKKQTTSSASLWKHLTNPLYYNKYYDCIHPYIIEYPISYEFNSEILQNIQDYSKVYTYLPSTTGVFEDVRKIQTDNQYFNKAIIYNDQQSSGILTLEAKPKNNLQAYNSYPKYKLDTKVISYTKSDNFYQYNLFWDIVKNKSIPLFDVSCESLSIDKVVAQDNMDYASKAYTKAPFRAKDLKIRHILDNSCVTHIVSQFITASSQISYK